MSTLHPILWDAVVSVDEDIATTFEIHDFNDSTASDDKDKDRSALTYTITAGNGAGLFKIDGATGKVTLNTNKALDYETTPIHELTIQAADATTGTIKTDTAKLTINVKNKAADGAITFANKTGSLNEDSAIGSTVGTMAATTADGSTISKFEIKSAVGSTSSVTRSQNSILMERAERSVWSASWITKRIRVT